MAMTERECERFRPWRRIGLKKKATDALGKCVMEEMGDGTDMCNVEIASQSVMLDVDLLDP